VVPLVPAAVDALIRHRDRQAVERLVTGEGYAAHGFVFADAWGEPWRTDGVTKYHWTPMLSRLKLLLAARARPRIGTTELWPASGLPSASLGCMPGEPRGQPRVLSVDSVAAKDRTAEP